ncbi:MAG: NmrA/HSCARG family protein [Thermoleophilaceae bacterium]
MTDATPVLVTGGTGNQGGAVARELLGAGFAVRALVRDPAKPAARELEAAGAELVKGDMEDRTSLDAAVDGVAGVFSVQNFWEAGADGEVRQGKAIADAAAGAGVEHFVYTSVGAADRDSGVSHFDTKWQIEQHIGELGLKATVLRPVFLMENFTSPIYRGALGNDVLPLAVSPDTEIQMVASRDIGIFARIAFERPDEFIGRALEIAGDVNTPTEAAAAFGEALGRDVNHVQVPIERLREMNPEVAEMFEWYERDGYQADLPALREIHPDPMKLNDWIATVWQKEAP